MMQAKAKGEALIRVEADPRICKVLRAALEPEVDQTPTSFLKVSLKVEGGTLLLNLSTKELSRLRAGLNSYLRLIRLVEETLRMLGDGASRIS